MFASDGGTFLAGTNGLMDFLDIGVKIRFGYQKKFRSEKKFGSRKKCGSKKKIRLNPENQLQGCKNALIFLTPRTAIVNLPSDIFKINIK